MADWVDRWRQLLPMTEEGRRRFNQGRAFQRSGRVTGVRTSPGRLVGQVQGSRATPYLVEVLLPPLDDAAWATVLEVVAGQARHAARLLAGQLPDALAGDLAERGIELFAAAEQVDARCACGEASRPCAHVVALWEAAAERFAQDPFAFLLLRGRGREHLLAELAAARRRAGGRDAAEGLPVADLVSAGWVRLRAPLDDLELPGAEPPESPAGPLRLLGDPPGWAGNVPAGELFRPLVVNAADCARDLLAGGDPES